MTSTIIETVPVREEQRPRQYPGLIALVSAGTRADKPGKQAAEIAVEYHLGQTLDSPPPTPPIAEGIPPDLYRRLTTALLPTGDFNSQSRLESHFVDVRISPWRYRLPEATTPQNRLQETLSFLYQQFSSDSAYTGGQSNALVLFLHVLGEALDSGDGRQREIIALANMLTAIAAPPFVQGAPLRHCWLIGSYKGSLPQAEIIKEHYARPGLTIEVRTVYDAFGVQETYDLVRRIYEVEVGQAGLRIQDVIGDFTGGVKPMSTGLLLACAQLGAPMQYILGKRGDEPSEPRLIDFVPSAKIQMAFGEQETLNAQ